MRGQGRGWLLVLVLLLGAGCAAQTRAGSPLASETVVWDCGWRVVAQP